MKSIFFIFIILFSAHVFAMCPLCTFTIGAGIGLAQYFGVDDTVTGIWIGGLIVSMIAWTINWLNGKDIHFYGRKFLVCCVYYGMLIVPLYAKGIIGHVLNKIWGVDKILFGIIIGSIVVFCNVLTYEMLKRNNNNRAYFPYQKVIVPVMLLVIFSLIFYIITK